MCECLLHARHPLAADLEARIACDGTLTCAERSGRRNDDTTPTGMQNYMLQ